jgi:hypothetical protein
MGATITCRQPAYLWNGNQVWHFEDNTFINCFLPYFAGDGFQNQTIFSYGDQVEPATELDFVATAGKRWVAVNPHIYGGYLSPFTNNWIVTNTSNYSTWRTFRDTTNCIRLDVPAANNLTPGSFLKTDGLLKSWTTDAGNLTNLNASMLAAGTIPSARFPVAGWTNAATFSEASPYAMSINAWQTNVNQRMLYTFRFSCASGVTDPVHAEILIDNERNGSWDKRLTVGAPAATAGTWTNTLSTIIPPNARFTFTNYSGAGASLTLIDVIKEGL